jgi:hypothetical protein
MPLLEMLEAVLLVLPGMRHGRQFPLGLGHLELLHLDNGLQP